MEKIEELGKGLHLINELQKLSNEIVSYLQGGDGAGQVMVLCAYGVFQKQIYDIAALKAAEDLGSFEKFCEEKGLSEERKSEFIAELKRVANQHSQSSGKSDADSVTFESIK